LILENLFLHLLNIQPSQKPNQELNLLQEKINHCYNSSNIGRVKNNLQKKLYKLSYLQIKKQKLRIYILLIKDFLLQDIFFQNVDLVDISKHHIKFSYLIHHYFVTSADLKHLWVSLSSKETFVFDTPGKDARFFQEVLK